MVSSVCTSVKKERAVGLSRRDRGRYFSIRGKNRNYIIYFLIVLYLAPRPNILALKDMCDVWQAVFLGPAS